MPGFDGTGPRGMGPMTGGGRGFCSPWGIGAGMRYGFGGGYGYPYQGRYGYPAYGAPYGYPGAVPYPAATGYAFPTAGAPPPPGTMTGQQELDYLKSQAQGLSAQLSQIESRISELEKK